MKKNGNSKKNKIILVSVCTVFVIVMTVWIGTLVSKNHTSEALLAEKQNELNIRNEENTALEALLDEENETALMKEYARKSGYVYPDERVYINGS